MEAELLVERARKAAASCSGFLKVFQSFTGGPNYDEAASLMSQAANIYKTNGKYKESSQCFLDAATYLQKANDAHGEAASYVEAINCIKLYDTRGALQYVEKATHIYVLHGRHQQAGRLLKGMAESFEKEYELRDAIKFYKRAADMFQMEQFGKSQYSQCQLKYAEIASRLGDKDLIQKSIDIYEAEAQKCLQNDLIMFNAKEYLFKAAILLLARGDLVEADISLYKYESMDVRFASSREGQLIRKIYNDCSNEDVDSFVEHLQEFDNITKLDSWKIHFFNMMKDNITPEYMKETKYEESAVEGQAESLDLT